jgi:hypothetical protein
MVDDGGAGDGVAEHEKNLPPARKIQGNGRRYAQKLKGVSYKTAEMTPKGSE